MMLMLVLALFRPRRSSRARAGAWTQV